MASVRVNQCRTHPGGTFTSAIKRGRPPVKCSEESPCTKADVPAVVVSRSAKSGWCSCRGRAERHERASQGCKYAPAVVDTPAEPTTEPPRKRMRGTKAVTRVNGSVPLAHAAKSRLEPLDWSVTGRAWFEGDNAYAEVIGTRGEEMITLTWENGTLIDQQYSIWNTELVVRNLKPESNLPFDTDEMPDSELAKELTGRKVTWWNRLGSNQETGKVPDKIQVRHVLSATGDEVPDDRVITFVDMDGGGFRSFRLGALIKVA